MTTRSKKDTHQPQRVQDDEEVRRKDVRDLELIEPEKVLVDETYPIHPPTKSAPDPTDPSSETDG